MQHPRSLPSGGRRGILYGCLYAFASMLLAACSANELNIPDDLPAYEAADVPAPAEREEYRLQVGDSIEIKFFLNPELSETVNIRPDGKISVQLLDDVQAAGLTPSELDAVLTAGYSRELRNPDLTVIVREMGGRIYVGGEVNQPTFIPYDGRITASQAIFQAGGFEETAQPKSVILIRRTKGDERIATRLDLDQIVAYEANDVVLAPDDVLFVPKSTISKWNKIVEQYIKRSIPIPLTFASEPFFATFGTFSN